MGDLAIDSAVTGGDGRYRAVLSRDWEIWGPNGGYIATILLRAAGAHSGLPRPASLAVHFLGSAQFDEVQLTTETIRAGRRSESIRVSMRQGDRPIAEALVWTIADEVDGPEHDWTTMPTVPGPEGLRPIDELIAEIGQPVFRFWQSVELRVTDWMPPEEWEKARPLEPRALGWFRFRPVAAFEDPFLEAARVALILDTEGWPAASRAIAPEYDMSWMAPNMDLHVTFHQPPLGAEWLLCDCVSPISKGGLIGGSGTIWSRDGRILGTGIQQMMLRNVSPRPDLAAG